jgi:hypothetical protein
VAVWLCGCVRLCGCVAVGLCGCVAVGPKLNVSAHMFVQ